MEGFNPPDTLSFESDNLSGNWKRWKQDLNFYLASTEKDSKRDKVKLSKLLHCIGQKAREIYNTFIFEPKEHSMIFAKLDIAYHTKTLLFWDINVLLTD